MVGRLALAQSIESLPSDRTRITTVRTTLNHLTVLELAEDVEEVAAGSQAFKVEWRGRKVFVQPLEVDAVTNLFVWTRRGTRIAYELVTADSVERMHFAIDQVPPPAPVKAAAAPPQPPVPPDLLQRSLPVKFIGAVDRRVPVEVLVRDVCERDGRLYLRYVIRNRGTRAYEPGAPVALALRDARAPQSLYSYTRTQVGEPLASRVTATGVVELPVRHAEAQGSEIGPSGECTGIVVVDAPPELGGPRVLRVEFAALDSRAVAAVLVL